LRKTFASAACVSKTSVGIVIASWREQFCWECDLVARVEAAGWNQLTFSKTEIDGRLIQMLQPQVTVPLRIPRKETFHLNAPAFLQKFPSN
jgi:hypothetical protein